MILYKYVFNIVFLFILITVATNRFFAVESIQSMLEKKEKRAAVNKDIKFKKIYCSKKTKQTTADDEDHADDECHEEEEKEKETEKEREEQEEECEEPEREEKEREEKEDDEDEKEKTLDDIKTILLSLCMNDKERHLVENLSHDQAKSLLKILQKS